VRYAQKAANMLPSPQYVVSTSGSLCGSGSLFRPRNRTLPHTDPNCAIPPPPPQVSVVLSKKNPHFTKTSTKWLHHPSTNWQTIAEFTSENQHTTDTIPTLSDPPVPEALFTTRTQRAVELKNIRSMEQENKHRNHDNTH